MVAPGQARISSVTAAPRPRRRRRDALRRHWEALLRPEFPPRAAAVVSVITLAVLGAADVSLGQGVDLHLFYLLPIFVAAWFAGLPWAVLLCVLAVAPSHVSDVERIRAGHFHASAVFNDLARILMLLLWASVISFIRRQAGRLAEEHQRLEEVTAHLEDDLEAAHRVQTSLLAQPLPELPRISLSRAYRAARQVGGDVIDVDRDGDYVAVCVADVCGKGVQAALLTAAVKGWLDAAPGRFTSPAQVATYMDERLGECLPTDMFVTMAYAVLNTRTGDLCYAVAGHELPLLRRAADGVVEPLATTGTALGFGLGLGFREETTRLQPGDALVLFTDGLPDARIGDARLGIDALTERLRAVAGNSAPALVQHLLIGTETPDEEAEDDVAVVAFVWQPSSHA